MSKFSAKLRLQQQWERAAGWTKTNSLTLKNSLYKDLMNWWSTFPVCCLSFIFFFFLNFIDVSKVCTLVTTPQPIQGFSLCVLIFSSSLCLSHYWSKEKKKTKKKMPEPSVSSPAAWMHLHSYPTVVGTLIALMEIHWEWEGGFLGHGDLMSSLVLLHLRPTKWTTSVFVKNSAAVNN